MADLNRPEPPPSVGSGTPIWDLVIDDMRKRDAHGRKHYGPPLLAHNGRDPLVDAYQEALDLAVYLRQAIAERDEAPIAATGESPEVVVAHAAAFARDGVDDSVCRDILLSNSRDRRGVLEIINDEDFDWQTYGLEDE